MPYQDRVFDPTTYALSIGGLMARQGDAAARAAEIIGSAQANAALAKGNAWANIGRAIADVPANYRAMKDAQIDRQLKNEGLQATVEARKLATLQRTVQLTGRTLAAAKTPEDAKASIQYLLTNGGLDETTARTVIGRIDAAGPEGFDALRAEYVNFANRFEPLTKYGEGEIGVQGMNPDGTPNVVGRGNPKPKTDTELAIIAAGTGPEAEAARRALAIKEGPKVVPGSTGGTIVGVDGTQTVIQPIQTPKDQAEVDEIKKRIAKIDAELNGTLPPSMADKQRLQLERERLAAQVAHWKNQDDALDTAPTLTPEAKDIAARAWVLGDPSALSNLGMGKQGAKLRTEIMNRGAEMWKGLDLASARAAFRANQESLKKLQGQADAVTAFENTAAKNIDLFLEQAKKVADSGIPVLNTPIRWASGELLGSQNQAKYDAARQVAINEVAKVVSNPGLAGVLSDAARHEVEAFNPRNATLKQTIAVMDLLRQDMKNRSESYADMIADIQQRIANPPGMPGSTGTVRMRAPNGEEKDVPAAEVDHYRSLGAVVVQ